MIDFTPLFETLKEKGMKKSDLYEILDEVTVSKFSKNVSFRLDTIEKVCLYLDVPIEKVVQIKR
ncbi:helix-turn-helix domain-containing protein [Salibacterium aidingense]|uniref:helix-turn-helix domain-containing protein n=1 Tax=Salibacterium aidingense TaxID=384933 RepID=UPI003BCA8DF2